MFIHPASYKCLTSSAPRLIDVTLHWSGIHIPGTISFTQGVRSGEHCRCSRHCPTCGWRRGARWLQALSSSYLLRLLQMPPPTASNSPFGNLFEILWRWMCGGILALRKDCVDLLPYSIITPCEKHATPRPTVDLFSLSSSGWSSRSGPAACLLGLACHTHGNKSRH